MLISLKVNNCFIYNTETEFTMRSDMRNKHFPSNVVSVNSTNVLKSAIIMGPNNVGKTNFVKCIDAVRGIMLNEGKRMVPNIFNADKNCEFAISFCDNSFEYSFELKYDFPKNDYIFEKFSKITYDVHKNKKETIILLRDTKNKEYICNTEDEEEKNAVISAMKVTAKNNLLIYLLDTSQFSVLSDIKDIITSFAKKIDIVDMNNIPMKKTIEMLKISDDKTQKIVNFIINADLYLENYQYLKAGNADNDIIKVLDPNGELNLQEKVLKGSETFMDQLHLFSTYKGLTVPSLTFDSTGTKKIACLASYVIDALENGRILVVDELDNSLHFKLVRAIIAMFNNELNTKAQLICTVHDITLLDCQKLFRKEQIWFAHKDMENAYLYAKAYFKEFGDLAVPQKYVSPDGYNLGTWLGTVRKNYRSGKLSAEKIEQLEGIGVVWDPIQQLWLRGYSHAEKYYQEHGGLKTGKDYVCNDGYRLGQWLVHQRQEYKAGRMKADRIEMLRRVGFEESARNSI